MGEKRYAECDQGESAFQSSGVSVQRRELLRRSGEGRFGVVGEVGAAPCSFGEAGGLRGGEGESGRAGDEEEDSASLGVGGL